MGMSQPTVEYSSNIRFTMLRLWLLVGLSSQCEISVKNVGQIPFVWHISYAGGNDHQCSCLPHDMQVILADGFYCYHYMNCIGAKDFHVEVTDYAVYITVGSNVEKMCPQ